MKNRGMSASVVDFALAMERELQENDHKVGWRGLSSKWLLNRLQQEKRELATAIGRGASADEVESEAADIANFAMMIAENYRAAQNDKRRAATRKAEDE